MLSLRQGFVPFNRIDTKSVFTVLRVFFCLVRKCFPRSYMAEVLKTKVCLAAISIKKQLTTVEKSAFSDGYKYCVVL